MGVIETIYYIGDMQEMQIVTMCCCLLEKNNTRLPKIFIERTAVC